MISLLISALCIMGVVLGAIGLVNIMIDAALAFRHR